MENSINQELDYVMANSVTFSDLSRNVNNMADKFDREDLVRFALMAGYEFAMTHALKLIRASKPS